MQVGRQGRSSRSSANVKKSMVTSNVTMYEFVLAQEQTNEKRKGKEKKRRRRKGKKKGKKNSTQ